MWFASVLGTSITFLPDDLFNNMSNLRRFSLWYSKLQKLPPSFFTLPKLETFGISNTPPFPFDYDDIRKAHRGIKFSIDTRTQEAINLQISKKEQVEQHANLKKEIYEQNHAQTMQIVTRITGDPASTTKADVDFINYHASPEVKKWLFDNLSWQTHPYFSTLW